jgi:hypothetical protein
VIGTIRCSRNARSGLHSRGYASIISSRVSITHFRQVKWIFSTEPSDRSPLFFRYGAVIKSLFSLFLNSLSDRDSLCHPLIHPKYELLSQQFFPHRYPLNFDGIIILPIFLHVCIVTWVIGVPIILAPVLILILLLFILDSRGLPLVLILLLFILDSCRLPLVLSLLVPLDSLCLQLVQYVLYLPLELLVRVLHHILEHLAHSQLIRLHLQTLPSQNRVQGPVHVRPHLQVLALDQLTEDLENFWDLFTLALTLGSK